MFVSVAPKLAVDRVPSVTKALFGESVQLTCPISEGNPVPTRKWYKDGVLLDMNSVDADIFIEVKLIFIYTENYGLVKMLRQCL